MSSTRTHRALIIRARPGARSNKLDASALCALSEGDVATAWGLQLQHDVPTAACAAITVAQDTPLRCARAPPGRTRRLR